MKEENDNVIEEQPEENLCKIDMDRIKIFLKVHPPEMGDKSYYDIDLSKNIFTLYDQLKVHLENQNYMKWIKYLQMNMKIQYL